MLIFFIPFNLTLICKAGQNINNLVLTLSVIIVLVTWDTDSRQTAPLGEKKISLIVL